MCYVYSTGEILEMSGKFHNFLEHLKEIGVEPEPDPEEETVQE